MQYKLSSLSEFKDTANARMMNPLDIIKKRSNVTLENQVGLIGSKAH